MKRPIGLGSALVAALFLAGCGGDKPVGGVSADEAASLNNAAEMLDASPDSLSAPVGIALDNEADSEGDNASQDDSQN